MIETPWTDVGESGASRRGPPSERSSSWGGVDAAGGHWGPGADGWLGGAAPVIVAGRTWIAALGAAADGVGLAGRAGARRTATIGRAKASPVGPTVVTLTKIGGRSAPEDGADPTGVTAT